MCVRTNAALILTPAINRSHSPLEIQLISNTSTCINFSLGLVSNSKLSTIVSLHYSLQYLHYFLVSSNLWDYSCPIKLLQITLRDINSTLSQHLENPFRRWINRFCYVGNDISLDISSCNEVQPNQISANYIYHPCLHRVSEISSSQRAAWLCLPVSAPILGLVCYLTVFTCFVLIILSTSCFCVYFLVCSILTAIVDHLTSCLCFDRFHGYRFLDLRDTLIRR